MPAPVIVTLFRPENAEDAWLVIPEDETQPVGRWKPGPERAVELLKELRGRAEGRFEVEFLGLDGSDIRVRRRLAARDETGRI